MRDVSLLPAGLIALFALLLLQSCAVFRGEPETAGPLPPDKTSTYYYECDAGADFTVRVQPGNAWLFLEDAAINLPQRKAASGVKYQSRDYLFWIKGDEAILEKTGGARSQCRNNPARAVWETAKLDGEDFRATGNEPGWSLVLNGERIRVDTDYGTRRYDFPATEPDIDVEGRVTRYQSNADGHSLSLQLEGQPCLDSMSDQKYPTRVLVIIDDQRLRGCGRPLH